MIHYADLRGSYDEYVKSLPESVAKRISRTERYRRALQREAGAVSFDWNSGDPSHLALLLNWKSPQFETVRQWLSRAPVRPFLRELADSDSEDCSGITSVLAAGSRPIAILFSLRCGHILAPWIIAHDLEYSRFSPGTMMWLTLFREAATRGVEMVDFGYGNEQFKQWFGNETYNTSGGGVWASRLGSAARTVYRRARFRD